VIIQKRYREKDAEWETVDETEFLRRTEWAGYWKKGTALQALKDAWQLSTPWVEFRLVKQAAA
jgi:hypothetical protein